MYQPANRMAYHYAHVEQARCSLSALGSKPTRNSRGAQARKASHRVRRLAQGFSYSVPRTPDSADSYSTSYGSTISWRTSAASGAEPRALKNIRSRCAEQQPSIWMLIRRSASKTLASPPSRGLPLGTKAGAAALDPAEEQPVSSLATRSPFLRRRCSPTGQRRWLGWAAVVLVCSVTNVQCTGARPTPPTPRASRPRGLRVTYTSPDGRPRKGLADGEQLYGGSHAVVIGINTYTHLPQLQAAVADATAVAMELERRGFAVRPPLLDGSATRAEIARLLGDVLPREVGPQDRVVVFFSGHGATTGWDRHALGYLMPVDGQRNSPRATGISMSELQRWLAGYKAKHVLFVADACYSGLALSTKSAGLTVGLPEYLRRAVAAPVRLALVAGGKGEQASEDGGQGLLTRFFLEAIQGPADRDADGVVTSDELAAYVKPQVAEFAARRLRREQHPQMGRSGEGEMVFLVPGMRTVRPGPGPSPKATSTPIPPAAATGPLPPPSGAPTPALALAPASTTPLAPAPAPAPASTTAPLAPGTGPVADTALPQQPPSARPRPHGPAPDVPSAAPRRPAPEPAPGLRWVKLPGGRYLMGSQRNEGDERPRHGVTLAPFELLAAEVTVDQYRSCVDAERCPAEKVNREGSPFSKRTKASKFCNWGHANRGSHPMNCVSWAEATAVCAFLGGRLPREAEWEYAARSGGQGQRYPWGKEPPTCERAVVDVGCSDQHTAPTCARPAGNSAQGACDLIGGVWEWVADWHGRYPHGPARDPRGPASGRKRVLRGGGWRSGPRFLRATNRSSRPPDYRRADLGVRCARAVVAPTDEAATAGVPSPGPQLGSLVVIAKDRAAKVLVDGRDLGPPGTFQLPPGRHDLRVVPSKRVLAPFTARVGIAPARQTRIVASFAAAEGTLTLRVEPPTARLYLDGIQQDGATIEQRSVAAGPHEVRAEADGHVPAGRVLDVAPGQGVSETIRLQPKGVIAIESRPSGASVWVDGREMGTTPWRSGPLDAGPLRVTCRREGYPAAIQEVVVRDGEVAPGLCLLQKAASAPDEPGMWVRFDSGSFAMGNSDGDPDEQPVHVVHLAAFEIMRTQVTDAMYARCAHAGACAPIAGRDTGCRIWRDQRNHWRLEALAKDQPNGDLPVVCVTHADAKAFARWRGNGARLCSEAEWEYAARSAGQRRRYPWGESAPSCTLAVMLGNCRGRVGTRAPGCGADGPLPACSRPRGNTLQGLCDMAGNVFDWVADTLHESYEGAPTDGSAWISPAATKGIIRGGAWHEYPRRLRTTHRTDTPMSNRTNTIGFRLCRPAR